MTGDADLLRGVGAAIAAHRRAVGVTQLSLAERIGKSVQWVSAVEQGRRHAERLTDLVRIASAIGCTVDDLIGRPLDGLTPRTDPAPAETETAAALRQVIMRSAGPVPVLDPAPDLADVAARVDQAWRVWHESPSAHRAVGAILPALVADAHAARATSSDGVGGARTLAGAYQIARQWLHHVPSGDLAWVVSDRAAHLAREADDPYLIALSAWALSGTYRSAGHQDEATRICLVAADELRARIDPANPRRDLLGAYGMLHLAAAVGAAQSEQDGRAWALHRVAQDTAKTLGRDYYDPWTKFGSGNVDIHAVAMSAVLGRPDDVVELSARLDLNNVPSVERRSSALISVARGLVRRGEDESAVLVLLDAERVSADGVHDSTIVRELLHELIVRDRARARPHVRGLARRGGLLAT
jgi:transcriptional regulator with XRE-family HTH domain